jgi:hypothetical protein
MAAAQERRDCTVCDHYETREGQLGDHSFGQWVVTKEATTAQAGLERRDCDLCDHYEEREIEKLPERIQKVYGWYIDTDYLSIRQGPGTSYERVGWLAPHVQVEILDSGKQCLLSLDQNTTEGSITAEKGKRFFLVVRFGAASGNYAVDWK